MKTLPLGTQSFVKLRNENKYYVDKTPFIKAVMENAADVLLVARPRRFGKTLFMDTMKSFLNLAPDVKEIYRLFSGLKILDDQPFCDAFLGQHPVVFVSFKDIDGPTFDVAYQKMAELVSDTAKEFAFLADSPNLLSDDKERLKNYMSLRYLQERTTQATGAITASLKDLVAFLCKHYGKQVILLIDEYDVPLAKAAAGGYYDAMLPLVRGILGEVLKPAPNAISCLRKAVLTGCLRVGKESIFTGLNNPDVNTICSEDATLSEAIGFTTADVKEILKDYELQSRFADVKTWYDGYRFFRSDMYCPWDVINFCDKALKSGEPDRYRPRNYWANSSGNDVIDEFLGFLSGDETDKMQALLDGGTIVINVNEKLNYGELSQHNPDDFWTLLLFTGYLTIDEPLPDSATAFRVRLPNEEIRETFQEKVKDYFSRKNNVSAQHGILLAQAAFAGDGRAMKNVLTPVLEGYVAIRDAASRAKPENYYQGFLAALFACAGATIKNFDPNGEAGDGYVDFLFTSSNESIGVVIEIKRCAKKDDLVTTAEKALQQVQSRRYAQGLVPFDCEKRFAYGIAFSGKSCAIRVQAL